MGGCLDLPIEEQHSGGDWRSVGLLQLCFGCLLLGLSKVVVLVWVLMGGCHLLCLGRSSVLNMIEAK